MKWTDERPTQRGKYWFREHGSLKADMYEVYQTMHGIWAAWNHWTDGRGSGYLKVDEMEGQWAGPITEPER